MTSEPDNKKCIHECLCVNSCWPNCAAKRKKLPELRESIVHGYLFYWTINKLSNL